MPQDARSLIAVWLLVPGVLLALLASNASAQPPDGVLIDFHGNVEDYLEGSEVRMYFNATPLGVREVVVTCEGCPQRTVYAAPFRQTLRFPRDFDAPVGEPKWARTYEVRLVDSIGRTITSRTFNVHATDAYRFPDSTVNVLDRIQLQASGFPPTSRVEFAIYRHDAVGRPLHVETVAAFADAQGIARRGWSATLPVGAFLSCPEVNNVTCREFWVEPRGPGKAQPDTNVDRSSFILAPAETTAFFLRAPSVDQPVEFNRTETVYARFALMYEEVQPLRPDDLAPSARGTLPVTIYRQASTGVPPERVGSLTAVFDPATVFWHFNWTIPRATPYVGYLYYLQVEGTLDRYGNIIRPAPTPTFEIHALPLEARFLQMPTVVERTENARFTFELKYADGKPITDGDVAAAPRACLVPVDDDESSSPCFRKELIEAKHLRNGTWYFPVRFPVDDPRLQSFRLALAEEIRDNTANGTHAANSAPINETTPFAVVPATLRVRLDTAVVGAERGVNASWTRGDRITLLAEITYPDGTPFNLERNPSGNTVMVHVLQKNAAGAVTRVEDVPLRSVTSTGPRWSGEFQISRTSPDVVDGTWEIQVDARDIEPMPNYAVASFFRRVDAATVTVFPETLTPRVALAGTEVTYTFRLVYPDGTFATPSDFGLNLRVDAHQYFDGNATNLSEVNLIPAYDAGSNVWSVTWKTPRTTALTAHTFVVKGKDRVGNVVSSQSSPPFEVYVEQLSRATRTQPQPIVGRGDSAYVVFEGADGDSGNGPTGRPRIELHQRNQFGQWVIRSFDVYAVNESLPFDHLGIWRTNEGTALGEYRFAFYGRAADRAILVGYSNSFNVTATFVDRDVLTPPPLVNGKGSTVAATFLRRAGDVVEDVYVYRGTFLVGEGRVQRVDGLNVTVSWQVPFTMDVGNYTFVVRGRDGYGNTLRVVFPPFLVGDSGLSTVSILQPQATAARGEVVKYSFRVAYPDGTLMAPDRGFPSVVVRNDSGSAIVSLTPTWNRAIWEVTWTPPADLPIGDYSFLVTGVDNFSNPITPLLSRSFGIEPGTFSRGFNELPASTYRRFATITASVASEPEDAFVTFTLGYLSRFAVPTEAAQRAKPTPVAIINHTWNPVFEQYDLETTLPYDLTLGYYVIDMKGVDRHGNPIAARSSPFQITGAALPVVLDANVATRFENGRNAEIRFSVLYPGGGVMTPDRGTPTVLVTWQSQPLREQVEVKYEDGWWHATWVPPPELPEGNYYFTITGADSVGNVLEGARSTSNLVQADNFQRIFGVPGPDPVALLGAVAVAGVLAARLRRDRWA